MKPSGISAWAACLFLIISYSASVHAASPAVCFQSDDDYAVYLKYGDNPPSHVPDEDRESLSAMEKMRLPMMLKYSPARRKPITINVKQTQAGPGQMINADASGSTTPSGSKTFSWGSQNSASVASATAEYSTAPGASKGAYSNIKLTVSDPVCGSHAATTIQMSNQY